MTAPRPRPWQLWWTDFDPQVGHEQAGLRPAVVVGTQLACELPNGLVVLAPCSTTDRGLPFHPALQGLDRPTFVLCDQVKSVSVRRLVRPHPGSLRDGEIAAVRFALRQMIDLG